MILSLTILAEHPLVIDGWMDWWSHRHLITA